MTPPADAGGPGPGTAAGPAILLSLAPSIAVAADLAVLLRVAIDAEQVGAARLHLPAGLPDPGPTVDALRAQTRLVLTADADDPAAAACDDPGPSFVEVVLDDGGPAELSAPPGLVAAVARLADEAGATGRVTSVSGRGTAGIPVLLAAVAAGLHVRVGSADTGPPGPVGPPAAREDIALIARAAGLARIAGRLPARGSQARELLGLG